MCKKNVQNVKKDLHKENEKKEQYEQSEKSIKQNEHEKKENSPEVSCKEKENKSETNKRKSVFLAHEKEGEECIMPTAEVYFRRIGWSRKGIRGTVLIDTGASDTFIARRMVEKLAARIIPTDRKVIYGIASQTESTQSVELSISPVKISGRQIKISARIMEDLGKVGGCNPAMPWSWDESASESFPTIERDIDLLLGEDNLWLTWTSLPNLFSGHLTGLQTRLGLVVSGYSGPAHRVQSMQGVHPKSGVSLKSYECRVMLALHKDCAVDNEIRDKLISEKAESENKQDELAQEDGGVEDIEDLLRKYMTFECLGISPDEKDSEMKQKDIDALESLEKTLSFKNGEYEVGLTFRPDRQMLEDNYGSAFKRLQSLETRLRAKPELRARYNEAMAMYEKEGDVEDCTDIIPKLGQVFYLPHREVIRDDKVSSKCRVVFDASARGPNGVSLNGCLLQGPQGEQNLVKILIRFRWQPVAIGGDVKRMYLCVKMRQEDRDYLRYLWRKDDKDDIQIKRFTKVAFGVRDSSFTSQECFKRHAMKYSQSHPKVVDVIVNDRWVDDIVSSCETVDEAVRFIKTVKEIMAEGGFQVKKWSSSSKAVMETIPQEDRVDADKAFTFEDEGEEVKALGVRISLQDDKIRFYGFGELKDEEVITKRKIASLTAAMFDPLGVASPYTIRGKRFMQEVWAEEKKQLEKEKEKGTASKVIAKMRKTSWNAAVNDNIAKSFREWYSQKEALQKFEIDRPLVEEVQPTRKQLHMFSDASPWGVAATVYLRTDYIDGTTTVRLIAAKSRVAPKEEERLPRLELMGALIGARLWKTVVEAIQGQEKELESRFWVDSSVALQWILQQADELPQWQRNRVIEIQALTDKGKWGHVPGLQNPADLGTRGISAEDFCNSRLWKYGPDWLALEESLWPERKFKEDVDEALCKLANTLTTRPSGLLAKAVTVALRENPWEQIRKSCGTLDKVIRVTSVFMRKKKGVPLEEATKEDKERALKAHVIDEQYKAFKEEIDCLQKGEELSKGSKLLPLSPFLSEADGELRVRGRFDKQDDSEYPMMLPYKSRLAFLLVRDIHEKNYHSGPEWCLYHLRKKFWMLKARRSVKGIVSGCVICRRHNAAVAQQQMGPLPDYRLEEEPRPFAVTGVDFAGPAFATCRGEEGKYWVALFTCMSTRAIHLETVRDMTTETFLLALRRFMARRGKVTVMLSDNGRTFTKAAKEIAKLSEVVKMKTVQVKARQLGILWKFNVPSAPWWGGAWERMVRSVKTAVKKEIGTRKLTEDELITYLSEVEAVVNSRPMVAVSEDPSEPLPITPAMLMHGYDPVTDSFAKIGDEESGIRMTQMWKKRTQMQQTFFKKFQKDYIQGLLERQKWHKEKNQIKVGEIVLIDEPTKRLLWPLGIVEEAVAGRGGLVRSYSIRTAKGVVKRPAQRVVSLEVVHGEKGEERNARLMNEKMK